MKISTPADLKTLQWLWSRHKVTAYKAPLYTKNDQALEPFIQKTISEKIISRGAYYMFDQKRGLYYSIKLVQPMFPSTTSIEQTSG